MRRLVLAFIGLLLLSVSNAQVEKEPTHFIFAFLDVPESGVLTRIGEITVAEKDSVMIESIIRGIRASNENRFKLYVYKNGFVETPVSNLIKTVYISSSKEELQEEHDRLKSEAEEKLFYLDDYEFYFFKSRGGVRTNE